MAMLFGILALIAVLGGGAWVIDDRAYDRGVAVNETAVLKVKNAEIAALNKDNQAMQDMIDKERRENIDEHITREAGARVDLKELALAQDIAADQLGTTLRLQLDAAQNAGKNEDHPQASGIASIISGLTGTEGAKLTPETRYHLELMSITDEETAVLLGLCVAGAIRDRK